MRTTIKSIGCMVANTVFILIDILILSIIGLLFAASIITLLGIFCKVFHIWDGLLSWILCVFRIKKDCSISDLITYFGVFASITIVPIVSFLVSSHVANKKNTDHISEALAEAKQFQLYFVIFPFGGWTELVESHFNHCIRERETKKKIGLLLYDYCFWLAFKGKFFQSYKIDVVSVGYDDYFDHEPSPKTPRFHPMDIGDSFTNDTTGTVCGDKIEGTSVVVLVSDDKKDTVNYYLGTPSSYKCKNVVFELHIEQRDESEKKVFSQMYAFKKNCLRFFPIIRLIYQFFLSHHSGLVSYRLELVLDSMPRVLSNNSTKYSFPINDLDIKTIRKGKRKN